MLIQESSLPAFSPPFDNELGSSRKWLVANGLRGHASFTIIGTNTRDYHGLLVAALEPKSPNDQIPSP